MKTLEIEHQIEALGHIYRITRNDAGHPVEGNPLLIEPATLEAQLRSFSRYAEQLLRLLKVMEPPTK